MSSAALVDDHLLVGVDRVRLARGDEGRADIGEIRTHHLRRADRPPVAIAPESASGPSNHSRISLDQREGGERAGMPARAGGHRDQPVRALLDRLAGEGEVDHVVHGDPAPAVDRLVHLRPRAERGDDDRDAVLLAHGEILLQAIVGAVHDLVDGEGGGGPVGIGRVVGGEFLLDPREPLVEHCRGPCVQRREGADDPRLALRDHEIGGRDDEHR
jgi:hypothetical protein